MVGRPASSSLDAMALETAIALGSAFIARNVHVERRRTSTRGHALAIVSRAVGGISWAAIAKVSGRSGGQFKQAARIHGEHLASAVQWQRIMTEALRAGARRAILDVAASQQPTAASQAAAAAAPE